jgi:hypothetical protein
VVTAAVRPCALLLLLLLALLSGCSAVRLTYNQAPTLAWWWMDGYLDFTEVQAVTARQGLRDWFAWHRRHELPAYAGLLAGIREGLQGEVDSAQVCAWRSALTSHLLTAFEAGVPPLSRLAATLEPAQVARLEERFRKSNEELEKEYGSGSLQARTARSRKRTESFLKRLYGRLDPAQRQYILAHTQETSFDPVRWLDERAHRQAFVLSELRAVVAMEGKSAEAAQQARAEQMLRTYAALYAESPRADYQTYREQLIERNCALFAKVHSMASPKQRRRAEKTLRGWEKDLRLLASQSATATAD